MVISSEIKTAEQQFNQDINELSRLTFSKNRSPTTLCFRFSAFPQAVAETDQEATASLRSR
ncbi:MAG: hypothetical protein IPL05_07340, partial [Betaproteobacteria bacterium]|nr:hypothetical protein [Betaproteobacteria bacterium]